jgi:hypothetical protein
MMSKRRGRRPHNARKGQDFADICELVCNLAAETKKVTVDGEEVEMSWGERSFRLTLERALSGNRNDLAHVLRLMIKHPDISGSYRVRQVIFMSKALSQV